MFSIDVPKFSIGFPRCSIGFPRCSICFHRFPIGFQLFSICFQLFSIGFRRFSVGFPRFSIGLYMGVHRGIPGHMAVYGCIWGYMGVYGGISGRMGGPVGPLRGRRMGQSVPERDGGDQEDTWPWSVLERFCPHNDGPPGRHHRPPTTTNVSLRMPRRGRGA